MLPQISFLGYPILIILISYINLKACASGLVLIKFYQDLTSSFLVIFKIVNSAIKFNSTTQIGDFYERYFSVQCCSRRSYFQRS